MISLERYTYLYNELNNSDGQQVDSWFFPAGFGLGDQLAWWRKEVSLRSCPHEGLDFYWFRQGEQRCHLRGGEMVPAPVPAIVAARCRDYMGTSLFLVDTRQSCYVLSHINTPLSVGTSIQAGAKVGVVAPDNGAVPGHLHISRFQPQKDMVWQGLDWPGLHRLQVCFEAPFLDEVRSALSRRGNEVCKNE